MDTASAAGIRRKICGLHGVGLLLLEVCNLERLLVVVAGRRCHHHHALLLLFFLGEADGLREGRLSLFNITVPAVVVPGCLHI